VAILTPDRLTDFCENFHYTITSLCGCLCKEQTSFLGICFGFLLADLSLACIARRRVISSIFRCSSSIICLVFIFIIIIACSACARSSRGTRVGGGSSRVGNEIDLVAYESYDDIAVSLTLKLLDPALCFLKR
jgi:hypothetical protein